MSENIIISTSFVPPCVQVWKSKMLDVLDSPWKGRSSADHMVDWLRNLCEKKNCTKILILPNAK